MFEIKFPPYTAAILSGGITIPLFALIAGYLEQSNANSLLWIAWFIVGFTIPMLIATVEIGQELRLYKNWLLKEGIRGIFIPPPARRASRQALKSFYVPAWKRMSVWFGAGILVLSALKLAGLNIG